MTRKEVCQSCSWYEEQRGVCVGVTKRTAAGTMPCHIIHQQMLWGTIGRDCPHPDESQREKFRSAETLRAEKKRNHRAKAAAMRAVSREDVSWMQQSPHSQFKARQIVPKLKKRDEHGA